MNNISYKEMQKWREKRVDEYYKLGDNESMDYSLLRSKFSLLQLIEEEEENIYKWLKESFRHSLSRD